ncbi:MAG: sigma-70 family RNA polymerase sigma factor [bacterium]|nr:sigma-70 family RNA polymerase sigma factor [bacterium]
MLIELARHGDIKALEEIIKRIQSHVYAIFAHLVSNKDDVSDLTQESLLKLAKAIPHLNDVNYFNNWLNKIITNTFNDYVRKLPSHYVELDEDKLNEIKDKIGCEPGEKCLFSELEKIIKAALLTLPHELRIAIVLREYEGLSYEDISKITNTTLGTVKSRISRARLKLQKELKEFI